VLVPELPFPKLLPGFLIASGRLKPETETKAPIWAADVIIAGPTARFPPAVGLGAGSRQEAPQPSLLPAILCPEPVEAVLHSSKAVPPVEDAQSPILPAEVAHEVALPELPTGNTSAPTSMLPAITVPQPADASVKVTRGHILRTQHNSNMDHRAPQRASSPGDGTPQRNTAKPTSTKVRALSQGCVSPVAVLSQLHSAESRPVTGGRSQTRGKTIWIRPTSSLQSSKSANVLQLPTAKAQHRGAPSAGVAPAQSAIHAPRVACKHESKTEKK
jgi:hypothetical protein